MLAGIFYRNLLPLLDFPDFIIIIWTRGSMIDDDESSAWFERFSVTKTFFIGIVFVNY